MGILERIKDAIIVSAQAQVNEPFYDAIAMGAMVQSVVDGGAQGLRLAGARDIEAARAKWPEMPIVGITKPDIIPENYKELVYITPSLADVEAVAQAGADIIAFDATMRKREVSVEALIERIHSLKKVAMADISTLEEGVGAYDKGADLVSTTLSGYTSETCSKANDSPDMELLEGLVALGIPTVLEGRIWTSEHVTIGFKSGAHCVVIGSAITRPREIVKYYMRGKK